MLKLNKPTSFLCSICCGISFLFLAYAGNVYANTSYEPCGKPNYSNVTESSVFVWKECNGNNKWKVRAVSGPNATASRFYGSVRNNAPISVVGYNLEKHDILNSKNPEDTKFLLRLWRNAKDGFTISANDNTSVCLNVQGSNEGAVYVGKSRIKMVNAFDLNTGLACTRPVALNAQGNGNGGTKSIPLDSACGTPDFDPSTQTGPWLWRDCNSPNEKWQFRIAAGGNTDKRFSGSFSSDQDFIRITNFDVDDNDIVDKISNKLVGFDYRAWNSAVDGLIVEPVAGSTTCFDVYGIEPSELKLGQDQVSAPSLPINPRVAKQSTCQIRSV